MFTGVQRGRELSKLGCTKMAWEAAVDLHEPEAGGRQASNTWRRGGGSAHQGGRWRQALLGVQPGLAAVRAWFCLTEMDCLFPPAWGSEPPPLFLFFSCCDVA